MGRSYSDDLRQRVVDFVDAGNSRHAAAAHFNVSPSFAVKLLARQRKTGSVRPRRQGRPPGNGKLSAHLDYLIGEVEAKPDITMPELAQKLKADRGVSAPPSSLSRLLVRAGFSYKKNADGIGARTRSR